MSFLPLLALGAISGLGKAAQAAPAQATRQSADYNPVVSVNNVNSAGDLNSVASLISALNAGNSYNGGAADFGLNSAPIGGGFSITSGVGGNNAGISVGPIVLIGAAIVALIYFKKK